MIKEVLEHIKKYTTKIDFVNLNFDQQATLIEKHLILENYGTGYPHTYSNVSKNLLNIWIDILKKNSDCYLEKGENLFYSALNKHYKKIADKHFNKDTNTKALLEDLIYPLGKDNKYSENDFNDIINELTFIDLFAGIGGFHQAMHSVGMKCVFASEWDKNARISYEANYKEIAPNLFDNNYKYFNCDITEQEPNEIPNFDVCCGGFPCQPFSIAGLKRGFEDTRGTLFFNIANIVKQKIQAGYPPKVLFLENVKGLRSHMKGETLKTILATLDELGYAYDYDVLNAKFFGVPQNRERLFIREKMR